MQQQQVTNSAPSLSGGDEQAKQPLCRAFLLGACKYPTNCRFSHDLGGIQISGPPVTQQQQLQPTSDSASLSQGQLQQPVVQNKSQQQSSKSRICHQFRKGHCRFGDSCRYAHYETNGESTSSSTFSGEERGRKKGRCHSFAQKGYCNYGDTCIYSHDSTGQDAIPSQQSQSTYGQPSTYTANNFNSMSTPNFYSPSNGPDMMYNGQQWVMVPRQNDAQNPYANSGRGLNTANYGNTPYTNEVPRNQQQQQQNPNGYFDPSAMYRNDSLDVYGQTATTLDGQQVPLQDPSTNMEYSFGQMSISQGNPQQQQQQQQQPQVQQQQETPKKKELLWDNRELFEQEDMNEPEDDVPRDTNRDDPEQRSSRDAEPSRERDRDSRERRYSDRERYDDRDRDRDRDRGRDRDRERHYDDRDRRDYDRRDDRYDDRRRDYDRDDRRRDDRRRDDFDRRDHRRDEPRRDQRDERPRHDGPTDRYGAPVMEVFDIRSGNASGQDSYEVGNTSSNQRDDNTRDIRYQNNRGNDRRDDRGRGGPRGNFPKNDVRNYNSHKGQQGRNQLIRYEYKGQEFFGFARDEKAEEALFGQEKTGIDFDKYNDVPVEISGRSIPEPIKTFDAAGLHPLLMSNIQLAHFRSPTPIQRYSMPAITANRDLMSCAQTGSGKTGAFLFPLINQLLHEQARGQKRKTGGRGRGRARCNPRGVILAPTRELATQINEEAIKFTYRASIRSVVVYGGQPAHQQISELSKGCDILVGTPGRLLDFMNRKQVSMSNVTYLCLDEADRMLDMGFEVQVRDIVENSDMPHKNSRQTLMFSATFPPSMQRLAGDFLEDYIFLAAGRVGASSSLIKQSVQYVENNQKTEKLFRILPQCEGLTLIFVETKRSADTLERQLYEQGVEATTIHGDREQYEREEALSMFACGRCPVLVATDVAARGLDIPDVLDVINYDMPNNIEDYVHRIGRTGRAGRKGNSMTFVNSRNRQVLPQLYDMLQESGQEIPSWFDDMIKGSGRSYQQPQSARDKRFGGRDYRGKDDYGPKKEKALPDRQQTNYSKPKPAKPAPRQQRRTPANRRPANDAW